MDREEEPDVDEIVRRYMADKKDFDNLRACFSPDYIELHNECDGDLCQCCRTIESRIIRREKSYLGLLGK